MGAHGALLGRLGADLDVAAHGAHPHLHLLAAEHLAVLDALDEQIEAILMALLDGGQALEEVGQLGETLLAGRLGEARVHLHLGVLIVLGILQILQRVGHGPVVQLLEVQLGMVQLVARRLVEDLGDLGIAVFGRLLGVEGILGVGHRLLGQGRFQVFPCLGLL